MARRGPARALQGSRAGRRVTRASFPQSAAPRLAATPCGVATDYLLLPSTGGSYRPSLYTGGSAGHEGRGTELLQRGVPVHGGRPHGRRRPHGRGLRHPRRLPAVIPAWRPRFRPPRIATAIEIACNVAERTILLHPLDSGTVSEALRVGIRSSREFRRVGAAEDTLSDCRYGNSWKSKAQFEKEIGKYVKEKEVARLWRYMAIDPPE